MKGNRLLILLLAFLLPIAVILFLRFFGENQFSVNPAGKLTDTCHQHFTQFLGKGSSPIVIYFRNQETSRYADQHFTFAMEDYPDIPVVLIAAEDTSFQFSHRYVGDTAIWHCLTDSSDINAAILDGKKIMGLYDVEQLREADRLVTELDIVITY